MAVLKWKVLPFPSSRGQSCIQKLFGAEARVGRAIVGSSSCTQAQRCPDFSLDYIYSRMLRQRVPRACIPLTCGVRLAPGKYVPIPPQSTKPETEFFRTPFISE